MGTLVDRFTVVTEDSAWRGTSLRPHAAGVCFEGSVPDALGPSEWHVLCVRVTSSSSIIAVVRSRLRYDEARWVLGLLIVVACSWVRWLATGSLKVDENYPPELTATILFLVLLSGWSLMVLGWRGLLARPQPCPRKLAFGGLLAATFMLPMLSNDVFSLLAYGSLAARGHDVYTTASALPQSPWFPWMGEIWSQTVCVYGPVILASTMPAAHWTENPWVALALLRLTWFVPLAIVMELSLRRLRDRPFFHAMVWLNPLWIVEGPGQLHADLLGLVLIAAGIMVQRSGRAKAGWVFYSLATLTKFSFAVTGFWFWLCGARTLSERVLRIPAMAAVLVGLAIVFFGPFWRGPATVAEPIRALSSMNPGGSITEVAGYVVQFVRGATIPSPALPARLAVAINRENNGATWQIVSWILRIVALAVAARVLRTMLRKPRDEATISLGTGALLVAAATLASHRFEPWYLIAALPFFGLHCTPVWHRWWIAAVAVSVAMRFVHVLPKTAFLLPLWSALCTAALIVVFLMSFKARYISLDRQDELADAR